MIIAQLSDMHVSCADCEFDALYHTADKLAVAIDCVNRLSPRPQAVVMTGDLVNCGTDEEYKILKGLLSKLEIPAFMGIGNHDCRDTFLANFPEEDYLPADGFVQYAIDMNGLRFIMLDTNIPGKAQGILCEERLDWLSKTLAEAPDTPTLIFMHHPPFKTGILAMDNMGLIDADNLGPIVEKHPQVLRIFCGHFHRSIQSNFYGKQAQVCPSTSHTILLHLEDDMRLATKKEPPEILLHIWDGKNGIVTHNNFIDDYPIMWELEGKIGP